MAIKKMEVLEIPQGNQSLLGLGAELQDIFDRISDAEQAGIEINPDELAEILGTVSDRLDNKLDGYAAYMRHCTNEASACKLEAEKWAARQKYWEGKHKRLKSLLLYFFRQQGIQRFETTANTFNLQNAGQPALVINDNAPTPAEIAKEYPSFVKIIPSTLVLDKEAIKKHLTAGGKLEFASLAPQTQIVKMS